MLASEAALVRAAMELGALSAGGSLTPAEQNVAKRAAFAVPLRRSLQHWRAAIRDGGDPLGDALCELRSPSVRRSNGAFYTPISIVDAMLVWVASQEPGEVVDCGTGTGRFAVRAASMPGVDHVLAIDNDPMACLITRATLAAGDIRNVRVLCGDFTTLRLQQTTRRRAFVGNPPYVRHHQLAATQKKRGQRKAADMGIRLSGLAGLHAHFLVSAAALMNEGDVLCFITSAEWLDVNYGRGLRELMLDGLRLEELHLLDTKHAAFVDAASTAAIVCARSGGTSEVVRFKTAKDLQALGHLGSGGHVVDHADLRLAQGWGRVAKNQYADRGTRDEIALGSIARVHRGAVTGANDYFVMKKEHALELGLANCVRPVLSAAEQLLRSDGEVRTKDTDDVLLCPPEKDRLSPGERRALNNYLRVGEKTGVPDRYVPAHRTTWWRPQVLKPAPIVATYMARQAPFFALNPDGLLILNVIHGVYPIMPLSDDQLRELVPLLNSLRETYRGLGRTYLGGLEKFEPREMERLKLVGASARRFAMLCDGP